MKSEINEKVKANETGFPKLMIHSDGTVVLMNNPNQGYCIRCNDGVHEKLAYREDWRINTFQDFKGSITLSNE
jgi:hypothetical protein